MTKLTLDAIVSRRVTRIEPDDFAELHHALAAVIEDHRPALIAYARAEYAWPLDRDWSVDQVLLLACVIAAQVYAANLDDATRTLYVRAVATARQELAQALAKVEKWAHDPKLLGRLTTARARAISSFEPVVQRLPKPRKGRPVAWELKLREYLVKAGLDAQRARDFARDLIGVFGAVARTP